MPRRIVLTKAGGPNTLAVISMDMPEPKAGEIRIEVAYAGINFADLLMRLGLYQPRPKYPFTPGYEMSGTVDAVGEGVTEFTVGQRVVAGLPNGGQASHVIVPSHRALALPDDVGLDVTGKDNHPRRRAPVNYICIAHAIVALLLTLPFKPLLEGLPLEGDTSAHQYWISERHSSLQDRATHHVGHIMLLDIPVCHPVHGPHDLCMQILSGNREVATSSVQTHILVKILLIVIWFWFWTNHVIMRI